MKKVILILSSMLVCGQFAMAGTVECNFQQKLTKVTTAAQKIEVISVIAHEKISGHQWISTIGLKKDILAPAQLGGVNTVSFKINAGAQIEKTKTYIFEYKRPWEKNTPAASVCAITVVKK